VLLVFNESAGANDFAIAIACAIGNTGRAESVCSSAGATATGRHDGFGRQ
jgi:hypothetical protein